MSIRFYWVNRAKRPYELEVLLVCTLAVLSDLVERCGSRILLGKIDAQYVRKHIYGVDHDRCIIDEIYKIKRTPVFDFLPQNLIIQVANGIAYAVHARADTIPGVQTAILLLLKILASKRELPRDMLFSTERIIEFLNEIRIKAYLICWLCVHFYSVILPSIILGRIRFRAISASLICLANRVICLAINDAYSLKSALSFSVGRMISRPLRSS